MPAEAPWGEQPREARGLQRGDGLGMEPAKSLALRREGGEPRADRSCGADRVDHASGLPTSRGGTEAPIIDWWISLARDTDTIVNEPADAAGRVSAFVSESHAGRA